MESVTPQLSKPKRGRPPKEPKNPKDDATPKPPRKKRTKPILEAPTPIEPEVEFKCEHCGVSFKRETTWMNHLCVKKQRWMDRDKLEYRTAFMAWQQFMKLHWPSNTKTTYKDFMGTNSFLAFVKFANYCINTSVINTMMYMEWLLDNKVKIGDWPLDENYQKFLTEFLKKEDPFDAIHRSIETLDSLGTEYKQPLDQVLSNVSPNRICMNIRNGRISPWLLYQSNMGQTFLDQLNDDLVDTVIDVIQPVQWQVIFKRYPERVAEIKQTFEGLGW